VCERERDSLQALLVYLLCRLSSNEVLIHPILSYPIHLLVSTNTETDTDTDTGFH